MYHSIMERIANQGLEAWDGERVDSQKASIMAGLRHMGMPNNEVVGAVVKVIDMTKATLSSDKGRWILSDWAWARNEEKLVGRLSGRWIKAQIDRMFVEEGADDLWLIDYKTAGSDVPAGKRDAFVAVEAQKYSGQMEKYKEIVKSLGRSERIRKALYFPAMDKFIELP
jgi:hypothetical protein